MRCMQNYRRIVDLTLSIVPSTEERPLAMERRRTEELTAHAPADHPLVHQAPGGDD